MSDLTLYQLAPSPNSIKVRLALGAKKIDCAIVDVDVMDRAEVLKVSGQPLTPVLKHGDNVIYDSYAIMRYLDANFEGGPRLYDADTRERMYEIESWELFARSELGECMGMVVGQVFAGKIEPELMTKAKGMLGERLRKIEDALAENEHLSGTAAPNAADLTCAPFASYGFKNTEDAGASPITAVFVEHMRLSDADFPKLVAWKDRILSLAT